MTIAVNALRLDLLRRPRPQIGHLIPSLRRSTQQERQIGPSHHESSALLDKLANEVHPAVNASYTSVLAVATGSVDHLGVGC